MKTEGINELYEALRKIEINLRLCLFKQFSDYY